jgi:4'-phosphopantetheinyl transferase
MLVFARIDPSDAGARPEGCRLRDREVELWAFSLAAARGDVERWSRLLSADEREWAARFRRTADRDAYIVAHGVLRRLLAAYRDTIPEALELERAAGGQPALTTPHGTGAIHFNLAHSGGGGLLAVCGEEVGVDLERERDDIDTEGLADRFFARAESEAIRRAPGASRVATFFRHWVAKEALLKAQGSGLAHPLDAFAIRFDAAGDTAGVEWYDRTTPRDDWRVRVLRLPPGWHGALCARGAWHVRVRRPRANRA